MGFEGSDIYPEIKGTDKAGFEHVGIVAVKPLTVATTREPVADTSSTTSAQAPSTASLAASIHAFLRDSLGEGGKSHSPR